MPVAVSPPQGFTSEQRYLILGRPPHIVFDPPQGIPGQGGGPPAGDDELIEESFGVFDHLLYDEGVSGDEGFVLINE